MLSTLRQELSVDIHVLKAPCQALYAERQASSALRIVYWFERAPCVELHTLRAHRQTLHVKHPASSALHQATSIDHPMLNAPHQAYYVKHTTLSIPHWVHPSWELSVERPISRSPRSAPFVEHPAPSAYWQTQKIFNKVSYPKQIAQSIVHQPSCTVSNALRLASCIKFPLSSTLLQAPHWCHTSSTPHLAQSIE